MARHRSRRAPPPILRTALLFLLGLLVGLDVYVVAAAVRGHQRDLAAQERAAADHGGFVHDEGVLEALRSRLPLIGGVAASAAIVLLVLRRL